MILQKMPDSASPLSGPAQQRRISSEQQTILVVEMTPIIEELLVRIFMLTNYRVCTIDGRYIATHGWIEYGVNLFPDSVLLDVDISIGATLKDPLDFLRSFSEYWNARFTEADRPALLLLTTQAQKRHELQQEAYVDAVVTKPFSPQFLLHTVKTALEQRQEKRTIERKIVYPPF